ncbi:MAG: DUF2142 domain-containing protein, partial [Oscillospiraceae bacterium]|nr:DUF2142 domain-containing protein [Oscillospiraceae bacterium]
APPGPGTTVKARNSTSVYPIAYLPSIIGVVIARFLGLSKIGLLFLGRFFNLLSYCFGVMYAIKIIPFRKHMMTLIGLLPICISLAGSFSYDVFVITLSFLFIAIVLKLSSSEEKVSSKKIILPAVIAVLLAPAKAIYLPLLLLILLIPIKKYENIKKVIPILALSLLAACLLWLSFNTQALRRSIGSSVAVNVDAVTGQEIYTVSGNNEAKQLFTFSYIVQHIPQTILLITKSFIEQSTVWIQGLVGGRLGEIIAINIEIGWGFIIPLMLLVFLSTIDGTEKEYPLARRERTLMNLIGVAVVCLSVLVCISWTPINYTTIFGIQGRYFLPVLPLFLLSTHHKNLSWNNHPKEKILFGYCSIIILIVLQAFVIITRR